MSVNGRSNKQWAARALKVAQTRAARQSDPARQAATLQRGIRTALLWLNGTHPKCSQARTPDAPAAG